MLDLVGLISPLEAEKKNPLCSCFFMTGCFFWLLSYSFQPDVVTTQCGVDWLFAVFADRDDACFAMIVCLGVIGDSVLTVLGLI